MAELIFHPSVLPEVQAAYTWYEEQATGLGDDFITELESAYKSIKQLPTTWPKLGKNTRRFVLTKFPYAVVYKPDKDTCFILAVMHQSRKPLYWQDRQ